MVEKARRVAVEDSRDDAGPAWEVFVRDDEDDPPRYVGAIRATDADAAHEEATRLFAWYATEVWVCPASEIRRFSADATDNGDSALPESGEERRTYEL
ncbi:Htur_1727 family rSAM-partnered candidate RiPP [Halorussus amylolyticus]|uniref:Htur_1727 family rSAM-partnered candidate RiPP n=1 Tax=Halorussus amylolyticus TaxID=1126242 RepID=UPI00104511D1|nr:Htur_1727 family rSAM-partnered candidate RiPP [Halorussus amylolyticus]